ncbi:PAS domain S-box-containing protein [Collimonas sp. OK307]|uniref:PAS and helix-turn-helix domain-containing protein n=1 Tax=Collimonas sp. OK307 TaxID=1801620 RepID=UPI0008F0353C|nr:PAS and helix-turn-helix domain-containing protein [Collimonas sp. OK307]SFH72199.1 PAS domain S-box-containing protein [Collimonas sp. OK307]
MQTANLLLSNNEIDYRAAFYNAPVGQAIGRSRVIVDCNNAFAEMFGGKREDMIGNSFQSLYPTQADFEKTGERIAPFLREKGRYADDRVMKKLTGELFWVHVSGFAINRDDPYQETLWAFTNLSKERDVVNAQHASMTPRERDVAALLIEGRTGKEIGKALGISPRTVDIYRTRLLRKYNVSSTVDLVKQLL